MSTRYREAKPVRLQKFFKEAIMESEAIKFDEYLANNLEKRFEFLYENYSIMKILIKDYKEHSCIISV